MTRILLPITLCLFGLVLTACQRSIGHTDHFLLQNKQQLRNYFDYENMSQQEKVRRGLVVCQNGGTKCEEQINKVEELKNERAVGACKVYSSNLPFSLTDDYDLRTAQEPIRSGSPLNIIINRVHLEEVSDLFFGEIAVVVTVDDGKQEEPKQVIVAYEKGVRRGVDLPISDLLAYSTNTYGDEPVRIEVIVIDLDGMENQTSEKVLTTAAAIGSAITPAAAPLYSVASQVGKLLIQSNEDDIIAKFTFQLYPWKLGEGGTISGSVGVPRVAPGSYLVVRAEEVHQIGDIGNIHIDYDFSSYQLTSRTKCEEKLVEKLPLWPVKDKPREWPIPRLPFSHVILTVDNTSLNQAVQIINNMNNLNRTASGLIQGRNLTPEAAEVFNAGLDSVSDTVKRSATELQFHKFKTDPSALKSVFDLVAQDGKHMLKTEGGKKEAELFIRNHLQPVIVQVPGRNLSGIQEVRKLYDEMLNKDCLQYEAKLGTYLLKTKDGCQ